MDAPDLAGVEFDSPSGSRGRSMVEPSVDELVEFVDGHRIKHMRGDLETEPASESPKIGVGSDHDGCVDAAEIPKPTPTKRSWHSVDLVAIDEGSDRRCHPAVAVRTANDVVKGSGCLGPPVAKVCGLSVSTLADHLHEGSLPLTWRGVQTTIDEWHRSRRDGAAGEVSRREWVVPQTDGFVSVTTRLRSRTHHVRLSGCGYWYVPTPPLGTTRTLVVALESRAKRRSVVASISQITRISRPS